jgi:hypothetical protein
LLRSWCRFQFTASLCDSMAECVRKLGDGEVEALVVSVSMLLSTLAVVHESLLQSL